MAILALVVALATELLGDFIGSALGPGRQGAAGAGLLIFGAVGLLWRSWSNARLNKSFDGFVISGDSEVPLVGIYGYDLADHCARLIRAAFAENSALATQWREEMADDDGNADRLARFRILSELVEFATLSELSTHLTDFFNRPEFDSGLVEVFDRRDMASFVVKNRFLDLFSKPPRDRAVFADKRIEADVVLVIGEDLYYERFELVLPRGSTLRHRSGGGVTVENEFLRFDLTVAVPGFSTVLPWNLLAYLADPGVDDMDPLVVRFEIKVSFKPRALIARRRRLEYQRWATDFAAQLERSFSKTMYLRQVNAESLDPLLATLERSGLLKRPELREPTTNT